MYTNTGTHTHSKRQGRVVYLKRVGGGGRVKVGQNEYHDATANEEPVELQCAHIHTHTHMHSVLVFMYTH